MTEPEFPRAAELRIVLDYQKKFWLCESQLRWVRDHAFRHGCRDNDTQTMLDNLVEPMKLLAIKERLTS